MQKVIPFIWLDNQAEEAADFYVSVFKDSKIHDISRYDKAGAEVSGQKEGSAMVVSLDIEGQEFSLLNGGPVFKQSEAVSFLIRCKDQKEVDYYWDKLTSNGGSESQCGWCKDRFGVSWQVVPDKMTKLIGSRDREKSERAMRAMLQMKKLDIAKLEEAYDG